MNSNWSRWNTEVSNVKVNMKSTPMIDECERALWLECIDLMNSGSVDMQECFSLLLNDRAPLWCANVDWSAAKATNNVVIIYKLNDRLKVCLSACRAMNIHSSDVPQFFAHSETPLSDKNDTSNDKA